MNRIDWEQFNKRWEYLKLNEVFYLYSGLRFKSIDGQERDRYSKDRIVPEKLWVDDITNTEFTFFLSESRFEIVRNADGECVVYGLSF
jgi:hypothetical protein